MDFNMHGVEGTLVINERLDSDEFIEQKFTATREEGTATVSVFVTFDDNCNNGHNSFHITGGSPQLGYGCIHDDIARVFPELAHLIKWHGVTTDGPLHYIANTTYNAGNRDSSGLVAGEVRQIRNGRTGKLSWRLAAVNADGTEAICKPEQYTDSEDAPPSTGLRLEYVPWTRTGEGKERHLDYARSTAVWPEATDEQLCLPKEELTALLEARLPALMQSFRADMEAAGFKWSARV